TTPSSAPGRTTASSTPGSTPPATTSPASTPTETAAPVDPVAAGTELLQQADGGQCLVGPPGAAGDEVFAKNSAKVDLNGAQFIVAVDLTATGEAAWNELALACNTQAETCPSKQLAIVLDDIIQSAPVVNEPQFSGSVSISGDFSRDEAEALARVLNRGAFPVQVTPQSVQTVSPTLGEDSLRASVLAGIGGVVLVLLLLVVFYRRLTLLILAGMVVWGMLIFSTSAIVSQTTNYTLTLAGVTGIIVSVGVTVDSYVVYFERLKDEIRHGRTFRNSATRAFKASWRTIVAADLVSVIAAAVLFLLSVGSVRGFALYLGITTLCDLVVLFFFTRPAVALLAATGRLDRRDTFGIGVIPSGGGR
ncbi:MAG: SecD/SecF family protein translocase subunit, partial [Acidimicrobiia bacterium]|nr:SecD/SecF family protein translocase subunit [Acidimicrobiia bacterium]